MAHEKKSQQLGMNFGTARGRLDRDLLFKFAVQLGHKCHRCEGELTRDTFSIDHKTNWSVSEDPIKTFFDLENIAFSHMRCNSLHNGVDRPQHGISAYKGGCRCDECKKHKLESRAPYCKDQRRQRYLKYGT